MPTGTILDLLHSAPEYTSLLDGLKRGLHEQMAYGLSGSVKSFVAAALRAETGRPTLIITATLQQAERFREDLINWLPGQEIVIFPPMEYLPFEVVAHSPEVIGQRLLVLEQLARGENPVVIAPVAALYRRLTPYDTFVGALLDLKPGIGIGRDVLLAELVRQGYERVEMVESRGHVAVRGEILDLWPLSAQHPVRLEFWGDEIDEIRRFDVASQRTIETLAEVTIGPAREFILPKGDLTWVGERIRRDLDQTVARLRRLHEKQAGQDDPDSIEVQARRRAPRLFSDAASAAEKLLDRVGGHLDKIDQGGYFAGLEQYATFFYDQLDTFLDYFEYTPLVLVEEPARIREATSELEVREAERQTAFMERGGLLPGQIGLYMNYTDLFVRLRHAHTIYMTALLKQVPGSQPQNVAGFTVTPMQEFHGQWPIFHDEVVRWRKQQYRVVIVASTRDRQNRLREVLLDAGIESGAGAHILTAPAQGACYAGLGSLEGGFQWPGLRLVVVTDGEIYGRPKKRRRPAAIGLQGQAGPGGPAGRDAARIAGYQDLKIGDYVVHVNHGIGKYLGVQSETILGSTRDYLVIRYEGTDRLKIPSDQIDQIQKYIGAEGTEPRLNKLGGAEWSKVKARVKESVREMAAELLRLAAYRESLPGHPMPPDTDAQSAFEDAFAFEETPDQLQAAAEIKNDMQRPRPMDRLLLGDVGYGKTEVALRAAFKAAHDAGKQVAILVPTTILAQQHYTTCKNRFEDTGVVVQVLNRFKSAREQTEILKRLADGRVDLIIGTHRLLGEDIRFKDLGLLVVDEEQRFGVQHKERIKQLRHAVDVLTLSATPIPRTLHMAMVGLRDMSVITSPPEDRFPVETYVAEYDDELVREAIGRELSRGGQTFFVHNRVQSIDRVAARLQQMLPEARITVAHGQMKEEKLERIMLDFLEGDFDVLVATTIIESGIDIPKVNTMIVDEADHLGLSQLYQLRGRVGRSNRLAYSYFLYKRDKVLTEVAEKRLQAIKDFTELGSGFKIAMRDLEIRGAGNILGPEQHGFIVTVGFDLYSQLLEEAVQELKGEVPVREVLPNVEIQVDAFISDQYIGDPRQKIDAYKRIIAIRSETDANDVREELEDRFGALPEPVKNLLEIAKLKERCAALGVSAISQQKDRITVKLAASNVRLPMDYVLMLSRRPEFRNRLIVTGAKPNYFTLRVHEWKPADVFMALRKLIPNLQELSTASVR